MSGPPLHRMFHHYSEMPYSQRVLFTATLLVFALGYMFALTLIFRHLCRAGRGQPADAVLSGHRRRLFRQRTGLASGIGLERSDADHAAARGEHADHQLAARGATRAAFVTDVNPIIEKRCLICHDGSNPHIPNLTGYDNVKKVTEADTGTPIATLIRVSHIHLFGHDVGLLRHGPDVQPRLCAAGMVQVRRHRDAVRRHRVGYQLLVFHQAVPSVRAGS